MGIETRPAPAEKRCSAIASGTGVQCENWRLPGLTVCRTHGGATQASKRKSEKARMEMRMSAFATPVSRDDPEANPIEGFLSDYRRTIGRIRWYDEELAALQKDALIWGRTEVEKVGASEFTGTNEKYEAKAHIFHELQFRERQHLLALNKVWIGAKLDERKLEIQRAYVRALDTAIIHILTKLGHDIADPGVRQTVRDELLALPGREPQQLTATPVAKPRERVSETAKSSDPKRRV